jgi:hypothetical protein
MGGGKLLLGGLRNSNKPEEGRGRERVCLFGKEIKQMKSKFEFEFHQTNSMHQHVCNKHETI